MRQGSLDDWKDILRVLESEGNGGTGAARECHHEIKRLTNDEQETQLRFLDALRDSGAINMFGAAVPLAEMFDLDKREARKILKRWMDSFGERRTGRDGA